jgi:hypothetical protein
MAEPTGIKTIKDLVVAAAEFAGIASYGAGTDVAIPPSNAHDLDLCLRIVNDAIRRFIGAAPESGWRWQRRQCIVKLVTAITGTATGGTSTTLVDSGLAEDYSNDHFKDCIVEITAGTGRGESALVTSYTGASGTFIFSALSGNSTPDTTSEYAIGHRYKLPDDFGGTPDGLITYVRESNRGVPITWCHESEIRQFRENDFHTNYPYYAAIRAFSYRQYELIVYPDPIDTDTLEFPYTAYFNDLSMISSKATAGGATSLTDSTLANMYANDYFNGWLLTVVSGTGRTGYATVTDYTGSSGKFDFTALSNGATPDTTSYYIVEPVIHTHPAGFQFDFVMLSAVRAEAERQIEDLRSAGWSATYDNDLQQAYLLNTRMGARRLGKNLNMPQRGRCDRIWKDVTFS